MDVYEAISTQRAVRRFDGLPIPDGDLTRIGDYADHVAGAAAAVALVTPEAGEGWRRESIAFGYPARKPARQGDRKALDGLVRRDRW